MGMRSALLALRIAERNSSPSAAWMSEWLFKMESSDRGGDCEPTMMLPATTR